MEYSLGILAGGRGRRAGGRDKGLLIVDGQPLIARAVASVDGQIAEVIIACERNHWLYQHYADRVLCDLHRHQGPVAGVIALLGACATPLLAVLPCDVSAPAPNWLASLAGHLDDEMPGVVATDQHRHTPCALLRTTVLPAMIDAFDGGQRSLGGVYRALGLDNVEISGMGADIDALADLQISTSHP